MSLLLALVTVEPTPEPEVSTGGGGFFPHALRSNATKLDHENDDALLIALLL